MQSDSTQKINNTPPSPFGLPSENAGNEENAEQPRALRVHSCLLFWFLAILNGFYNARPWSGGSGWRISPGGAAAASACLFAPRRIPCCRPFRAWVQTHRKPWVPRCARHPRLRACRPSGAGNASRHCTRTPVGPDLVSGRTCRPSGLCCLIVKSGEPAEEAGRPLRGLRRSGEGGLIFHGEIAAPLGNRGVLGKSRRCRGGLGEAYLPPSDMRYRPLAGALAG
jgi:hypothetical protein